MHEVLVNRLGGLSLPRKCVVRLTDHPDMTVDVYRGRKTTIQYNTIPLCLRAVWLGIRLSDGPEFYGDLVYKFKKIIGKNDFPYHFKKIVGRYKKIGYNINVMRQTACLVVNPIKVNSFAYLFNCTTVGRTSD